MPDSYQRRLQAFYTERNRATGEAHPSSSGDEEDQPLSFRTSRSTFSRPSQPSQPPRPSSPLAPPRPSFLAGKRSSTSDSERGSFTSVDPGSESDREHSSVPPSPSTSTPLISSTRRSSTSTVTKPPPIARPVVLKASTKAAAGASTIPPVTKVHTPKRNSSGSMSTQGNQSEVRNLPQAKKVAERRRSQLVDSDADEPKKSTTTFPPKEAAVVTTAAAAITTIADIPTPSTSTRRASVVPASEPSVPPSPTKQGSVDAAVSYPPSPRTPSPTRQPQRSTSPLLPPARPPPQRTSTPPQRAPSPLGKPYQTVPQLSEGNSPNPSDLPRPSRAYTSSAPRPPPSSFAFPFQAFPGNPDPGMSIPGQRGSLSRRSSAESLNMYSGGNNSPYGYSSQPGSSTELNNLGGHHQRSPSAELYRGSAAAAMHDTNIGGWGSASLPRTPSIPQIAFRAPFLSPNSRPGSTIWTPPIAPFSYADSKRSSSTPNESTSAFALALPPSKPPLPSTRLPSKLAKEDKPWLNQKQSRARLSWWLTFCCLLLGVAGAGALCWDGLRHVKKLSDHQLCSVMDDNFDSIDLTNNWSRDVELGGFGNGEFQMTTSSQDNLFIRYNQLYMNPTLTTLSTGLTDSQILNGANYTLPDCTAATTNKTACTVTSNNLIGAVINPVMSSRITTKGKKSIRYGKVEVKAKLPRGDWLWPAIWMLPEDEAYGAWPLSGEIDIMEARGNSPEYPAQGNNVVRSSLNYGPFITLQHTILGWFASKRSNFASGFHIYTLEWTGDWIRMYVDNRLQKMLDLRMSGKGESFYSRGGFPDTAVNGSSEVVVHNPWNGHGPSAPFDQKFYLILDLAVGGTSGWFPDSVGNKPWHDQSTSAMRDFAQAQSSWYSTWPENSDDRAFRIDYAKMWQLC